MAETAIEAAVEQAAVPPKVKLRIMEAAKEDAREIRSVARRGLERAKLGTVAVLKKSVVVSVGGFIAEPVRRQLIGRFVGKGLPAQGFGLIGLGLLVNAGAASFGVPYVPGIGDAHIAVGSWILSNSLMYDSKDKRDALAVGLEETTYIAKHPKKSDKKD